MALQLSYEQDIILAECEDGNLGFSNYGIAILTEKAKYTTTPAGGIVSYSWNEETKLWISTESGAPGVFFNEALRHAKPLYDAFSMMADEKNFSPKVQAAREAYPKYFNQYNGLIEFLKMCRSGVQNGIIWKMIVNGLTKKGRAGMNNYSDWLPLKGGNKISLRTGEIVPRTRDDLWTYETNATGIKCTTLAKSHVRRYYTNICRNAENQVDEDYIEYFQILQGYWLTFENKDKSIYFVCGCGDSGKSELVITMTAVVTKNRVASVDKKVFVKSAYEGNHATHLYKLRGLSLAYVQEVPANSVLNADVLKAQSGGDEIEARAAYAADGETIDSGASVAIFFNTGMRIDGNDSGLKNRVKYIPIDRNLVNLPDDERRDNQKMLGYLKGTQDGINALLNHYVGGSMKYYANLDNMIERIKLPDIVKNHTKEFIADNDSFTNFLLEKCDVWDEKCPEPRASYTFARSALQDSYKRFCQAFNYEKDQIINAKSRLCQMTKVNSQSQGPWVGIRSKLAVEEPEPSGTAETAVATAEAMVASLAP